MALLAGTYSPANLSWLNWLFGSDTWSSTWRLWFLEALVWTLVAFAALLSVPAVRRLYARAPFALATGAGRPRRARPARRLRPHLTARSRHGTGGLWLVAIGWAAQVASTRRQRLLLERRRRRPTLPGFMDDHVREATIAAGLLLLVWVRTLPVPRRLVPALAVLASASLYIYLTHFEVYRTHRPAAGQLRPRPRRRPGRLVRGHQARGPVRRPGASAAHADHPAAAARRPTRPTPQEVPR